MEIATYLEKLRKMISNTAYVQIKTENNRILLAEIVDISEYGCSFELQERSREDLSQGRTVRVQWETLSEAISSTVIGKNDGTGFVAVRFEKMSKEQYVQLLEFIMETKSAVYETYGVKVS